MSKGRTEHSILTLDTRILRKILDERIFLDHGISFPEMLAYMQSALFRDFKNGENIEHALSFTKHIMSKVVETPVQVHLIDAIGLTPEERAVKIQELNKKRKLVENKTPPIIIVDEIPASRHYQPHMAHYTSDMSETRKSKNDDDTTESN